MPIIKIDNKDYDTDIFSEEAKTQLSNLNICDQEIQRLQTQIAIAQTARVVYARALSEALPK